MGLDENETNNFQYDLLHGILAVSGQVHATG